MSISNRKADHIQLCIDGDVGFKGKTTLFEEVDFHTMHCQSCM